MAAGKLLLLLVAGGLAGAAFAGMTTGVMRPYRDRETASTIRPAGPEANDETASYASPPAHQSWLDEGVSLLDSPAWPFGHGSADEETAPPEPDGYAPYGYDERERYDDRRRDHDDRARRGYRTFDGYAEAPNPPAYDEAGPSERIERPQPPTRRSDPASDAASRAADAAQDVIAAEHGN